MARWIARIKAGYLEAGFGQGEGYVVHTGDLDHVVTRRVGSGQVIVEAIECDSGRWHASWQPCPYDWTDEVATGIKIFTL